MKNLIKLFCIIILAISLNSCASYSISTIGHETVQQEQTLNLSWFNFERDYSYQIGYRPYRFNQHYAWYYDVYSYNYNWNNSWYNGYQNYWSYNNYWNYYSYNPWHHHHPYTSGWLGNVYSNNNYSYTYGRRGSIGSRRTSTRYSNRYRSRLLLDSDGSTFNSRTLSTTASPTRTRPTITTRPNTTRPTRYIKPVSTKRVIRSGSSSRPNSNRRPVIRKTQTKRSVQKTTTNSSRSKRKGN